MATKRGMCPYCKNHNYFLVNPEAMSCFCGTNMHQISPIEAINKYNSYVDELITKANNTLEIVGNSELAYQEFADVIELDDSITYPYLGRILCLIYMSKVRKSHVNDARVLLETTAEEYFRKTSEFPMIIHFLKKIVKVTEEYLDGVHRKLSLKTYFYDSRCLRLYLTHVNEVKEFENSILEIVTGIKKKFVNEKVDFLLNFLDELITSKDAFLKDEEHVLVYGDYYKMSEIKSNCEVEVAKVENKHIDTKLVRYRMASLDANNKKARYICDVVFKDYTAIIRSRKVVLVWSILFYLFMALCGVSGYLFSNNPIVFYSSIGAGSLSFIAATVLMILFVSWGAKIKKKKDRLESI